MKPTRILCLAVVAGALVAAQPAAAQMQPAGTGEPAYTNSAQNTQWFEWPATSGIDAYRGQFSYYENNVLKASPTYTLANGGTLWANWSGIATLVHGGQYGICAQGSYSFPNDELFYADGPNSCSMGTMLGRRAYTTIDRSKPTAAMKLNGGNAYAKKSMVPLKVTFADDVAGPFPANFLCFQNGGGPTGVCDSAAGYTYSYNGSCSMPATGGPSTTFACTGDYTAAPDGRIWACVIAADASIPDNPNSSDQRAAAERANLSAANCDDLVLDRKAPSVTVTAPASAATGQALTFTATASDATSGVKSNTWMWGDGTPNTAGLTASHAYATAGTYTVAFKSADRAGNVTTVKRTITVTTAAALASAPTTTVSAGGAPVRSGDVRPLAAGTPGARKLGHGPVELPDGRFHGARPDRTFAVR